LPVKHWGFTRDKAWAKVIKDIIALEDILSVIDMDLDNFNRFSLKDLEGILTLDGLFQNFSKTLSEKGKIV